VLGLTSVHVPHASLLKILLAQFKNRGRMGIVVDILDTVSRTHPRGRTKTQIMRGARLSYDQTCRYLDFLMMCDYIRGQKIQKGDRELVSYSLTLQGLELFRQLYTLHSTMELLERRFV
jgi:predicted transcriptional regulator